MKEAKSQADKRRSLIAKDQWDRPWSCTIELESGDFTGLIDGAGWEDPMRTPQQYVIMKKNEYGYPELGRVEINLDAWIRHQRKSMQDWIRNFWKVGKELYAARFDPAEMQADAYLLEQCGPKPWPSIECIEVLRNPNHQAHRALLGLAPINAAAITMLGRDPGQATAIKRETMTMEDKAREHSAKMKFTIMQFLSLEPTPSWQELVAWGYEQNPRLDLHELGPKWKAFKQLTGLEPTPEPEPGPELEITAEPEPEPEMETV